MKAIAQLPESQRQVLMLRYYSEMKFVDIAVLLGCPLNTALGRMHKAMLKLKHKKTEIPAWKPADLGIGAGYERHVKESAVRYSVGGIDVNETLKNSMMRTEPVTTLGGRRLRVAPRPTESR